MTSKDYDLNLWEQNFVEIPAVQGEAQSRTVNFHLKEEVNTKNALGGVEIRQHAIDLTGCSVRFYLQKPDQKKVFCDGVVTDAENGIATFLLPYQAMTADGTAAGEVLVTKVDGTTLKGIGVELKVTMSSMEELESTDDFSALVTALNEVKTAAGTASQAAADAQEAVSDANGAIVDINAKESEITAAEAERQATETTRQSNESARQTAETGRVDVEIARVSAEIQRQTDTTAAIANAEAATSSANTAADRANTAAQNAEDAISGQLDPAIDARIAAKTNVPGGLAGYDNAQAHYANAAVHVTTLFCAKTGTVYALAGLTATAGVVPCAFQADAPYAAGDTFTLDGAAYSIQTGNGSALASGAFVAGAIVPVILDIDAQTINIKGDPTIPTALPNPAALTVNQGYGGQTGTYDGSAAVSISVPRFDPNHTSGPTETLPVGLIWGVY